MNVQTFEINREQAETLYREYRDIPVSKRVPEDLALMKIYQRVAKGDRVINVNHAFKQTGLHDDGTPKLAIARADWANVVFHPRCGFGYDRKEGGGRFAPIALWYSKAFRRDYVLPADTFDSALTRNRLESPVPHIPAALRPQHSLQNYHILFEVEKWAQYPHDPFLLKRVAGGLFIVLAEWDLSPLELTLLESIRTV